MPTVQVWFGTSSANNGCRSSSSGEKGLRKSIESHPPNRPVAATNIADSKTFRLMLPLTPVEQMALLKERWKLRDC